MKADPRVEQGKACVRRRSECDASDVRAILIARRAETTAFNARRPAAEGGLGPYAFGKGVELSQSLRTKCK